MTKKIFVRVVLCIMILHGTSKDVTGQLSERLLQLKPGEPIGKIETRRHFPGNSKDDKANYYDVMVINNHEFLFPEGEHYIDNSGDLFLTASYNNTENGWEKTIKQYRFSGRRFSLLRNMKLNDMFSSAALNEAGNAIVVSDEYEGFGKELSIYDLNFSLRGSYRPFGESGFDRSIRGNNLRIVAGLFFPLNKQVQAKLGIINAQTGQVLADLILPGNGMVYTDLTVAGDFVILTHHTEPANQQISCYNKHGQLAWKKSMQLYTVTGLQVGSEGKLFVMERDSYHFINPVDGTESLRVPLSDLGIKDHLGKEAWVQVHKVRQSSNLFLLFSGKPSLIQNYSLYEVSISNGKARRVSVFSDPGPLELDVLGETVVITNSKHQIIYSHEK